MFDHPARILVAAFFLFGAVAAYAGDPATSPFAADRYDYNVLPQQKPAPTAPAAPTCDGAGSTPAAKACRPRR